jgi:hypothetical protein
MTENANDFGVTTPMHTIQRETTTTIITKEKIK